MTSTNCSNDRLVLRQNVEINPNEYFSCDIFFREWNRRPRGLETSLRNHQEICLWVILTIYYGLSNDYQWKFSFIMFIHHLLRLMMSFSFSSKTFRLSGSAFFGEMCRSTSLVVNTNLDSQKLRLRQHRPFMSIKSFEQTQQVGQVTR